MHPGHPLMLSMSDMILEQHANLLRQGAVLVDPADEGLEPVAAVPADPRDQVRRRHRALQAAAVRARGRRRPAPLLPAGHRISIWNRCRRPNDRLLEGRLAAPWIAAGQEARALALAAGTLVPEHYSEVAHRRITHVDKTLAAVHERLSKEIAFWQDRWLKLKEDGEAGKDVRLNLENARRTIADLEGRLESRKKELQSMRHVVNGTPVVLGGALIVPAGLMNKLRGDEPADPVAATFAADAAARTRIEQLAMDAVRRAEEARGCRVVDVSAAKCGWDLTSYPPAVDGKQPDPRHIEVKGRVEGREHDHRHPQRDALRLQSGRQVRAGHRAGRRRRRRRWPALHPQSVRPRARLGRRVHQLQPGRSAGPRGGPMTSLRLDKLALDNFRCFEHCEILFHPRLTVLVAENGNGKTALMDAASIALSAFVNAIRPVEWFKRIERRDIRLVRTDSGVMKPCLPCRFTVPSSPRE